MTPRVSSVQAPIRPSATQPVHPGPALRCAALALCDQNTDSPHGISDPNGVTTSSHLQHATTRARNRPKYGPTPHTCPAPYRRTLKHRRPPSPTRQSAGHYLAAWRPTRQRNPPWSGPWSQAHNQGLSLRTASRPTSPDRWATSPLSRTPQGAGWSRCQTAALPNPCHHPHGPCRSSPGPNRTPRPQFHRTTSHPSPTPLVGSTVSSAVQPAPPFRRCLRAFDPPRHPNRATECACPRPGHPRKDGPMTPRPSPRRLPHWTTLLECTLARSIPHLGQGCEPASNNPAPATLAPDQTMRRRTAIVERTGR